ncbi:hypothetical protein ZWY2020_041402 [Hordeum vulgare]|nr:hypothetical protein ZWY2020_041402 [Hordeum vulgare]
MSPLRQLPRPLVPAPRRRAPGSNSASPSSRSLTRAYRAKARQGRSFRGVLASTTRNKRAYVYRLAMLPPGAVDPRRPPTWSKILALRTHLSRHHWLFWNDTMGHYPLLTTTLLVPYRRFITKCKWSERLLDTWWNHTSFAQFGSTKSGDNAALKHIVGHLSPEETQAHIRIANAVPLQLIPLGCYMEISSPPDLPPVHNMERLSHLQSGLVIDNLSLIEIGGYVT